MSTTSQKNELLKKAVDDGDIETVELLLKAGVNANISYKTGDSVLMKAAELNVSEILTLLLKYGANIDDHGEGFTSLIIAAQKNKIDNVKALLEYNPDLYYKDATGATAYENAVEMEEYENQNTREIQLLLKQAEKY